MPRFDIENFAQQVYDPCVRKATEDLVDFLTKINSGERALCVTYFDEADELGNLFWVMLRLLGVQGQSTSMWYVFMATKSSVSYFHPVAEKR